MSRAEPATCGAPGCRRRAVFACSTDEETVVLCQGHLERWHQQEAEREDGGVDRSEGLAIAEAAA